MTSVMIGNRKIIIEIVATAVDSISCLGYKECINNGVTEMKLTALGRIAERSTLCVQAAKRGRDENLIVSEAYNNGQASAYNSAHRIMKAELQRLRNLLQNGSLTQADFGDDLPY